MIQHGDLGGRCLDLDRQVVALAAYVLFILLRVIKEKKLLVSLTSCLIGSVASQPA
jgi:hypothetical protein